MQEPQNLIEHIEQNLSCVLRVLTVGVQARLGQLDVPVAVAVPDELIDLLYRDAQLELAEI